MIFSSLVLTSILLGEVSLGPYVIPDRLPPSAEVLGSRYKGTLYEDEEGTPYVYTKKSNIKIFSPPIYDESRPFEVKWTPEGVEVLNSYDWAEASVEMGRLRCPKYLRE